MVAQHLWEACAGRNESEWPGGETGVRQLGRGGVCVWAPPGLRAWWARRVGAAGLCSPESQRATSRMGQPSPSPRAPTVSELMPVEWQMLGPPSLGCILCARHTWVARCSQAPGAVTGIPR